MRPFLRVSLTALLALCLFVVAHAAAHPSAAIFVDNKAQVYFSDFEDGGKNGFLWKIDAAGKLTRFEKGGHHWLALDEKGVYAEADLKKWWEMRITMNFMRVPLPDSKSALLLADGAPFVVDRAGNLWWGNLEVKRLSPTGKVTPLAPKLKETAEKLGGIKGLAMGPDGCLYASCPSAVLKIKPDGEVTTLVHPIVLKDVDNAMPRDTPEDHKPYLRGLAVDSRGNVYAAANGSRCVVKVTPDGKVAVVLKSEGPWSPTGVAVQGEDVYVLEYTNTNKDDPDGWLPRVRKLGRDGKVTTLATITREERQRRAQ